MNSRELERKEGVLFLNGEKVIVSIPMKPSYLSLVNGRNVSLDYSTEQEIRANLIPLAEQLCDKLEAKCYELGDKLIT